MITNIEAPRQTHCFFLVFLLFPSIQGGGGEEEGEEGRRRGGGEEKSEKLKRGSKRGPKCPKSYEIFWKKQESGSEVLGFLGGG